MRLQQVGLRRGETKLEVYVEGEVRWYAKSLVEAVEYAYFQGSPTLPLSVYYLGSENSD